MPGSQMEGGSVIVPGYASGALPHMQVVPAVSCTRSSLRFHLARHGTAGPGLSKSEPDSAPKPASERRTWSTANAAADAPLAPTGPLRVLIVDDDELGRELYRSYLDAEHGRGGGPLEITEADTGARGLELCGPDRHDCVLLDYALPDDDGVNLIGKIRELTEDRTAVVLMTGVGSERVATDALKAGAVDYLPKNDVTADSLARAIASAVEKTRLRVELDAGTRRIEVQNVELQKSRDEIRRFYQNVSHELATPAGVDAGVRRHPARRPGRPPRRRAA